MIIKTCLPKNSPLSLQIISYYEPDFTYRYCMLSGI